MVSGRSQEERRHGIIDYLFQILGSLTSSVLSELQRASDAGVAAA